jgi:hypothetical protein
MLQFMPLQMQGSMYLDSGGHLVVIAWWKIHQVLQVNPEFAIFRTFTYGFLRDGFRHITQKHNTACKYLAV